MDYFKTFPLGKTFCMLGLHQWAFVDVCKDNDTQITGYMCLCCKAEMTVTKKKAGE